MIALTAHSDISRASVLLWKCSESPVKTQVWVWPCFLTVPCKWAYLLHTIKRQHDVYIGSVGQFAKNNGYSPGFCLQLGMCLNAQLLSCLWVWLFSTLWMVAPQAPLFMEFFPGWNTRVGCSFLLFLTERSHLYLLHWQVNYLPLNHLENSVVVTGLEKVSFHSNPKEGQCQRMFQLRHNCTHLTC